MDTRLTSSPAWSFRHCSVRSATSVMLHRDLTTIFSVQRSRGSISARYSTFAARVISICTFSPESAPARLPASLLQRWASCRDSSDLFFSSSWDAFDSRDLMYSLVLIRIDVLSFCRKVKMVGVCNQHMHDQTENPRISEN
jgi:hypothetical protein